MNKTASFDPGMSVTRRQRRRLPILAIFLQAAALLAGASAGGDENRAARPTGATLALGFALLENQHAGNAEFLAELNLANRGPAALADRDWSLYFNFGRPMRGVGTEAEIVVEHVNGDLWRLSPTDRFAPLAPGEERRLSLLGRGAVTRRSDAPAGPYFVFGDRRAEAVADYTIAPFGEVERLRRAAADQMPVATTSLLFERDRAVDALPLEKVDRLVPTPLRFAPGAARIVLDPAWKVHFGAGLENEASALVKILELHFGKEPPMDETAPAGAGAFTLRVAPLTIDGSPRETGDEAYRLTVDEDSGVEIVGTDPAGVFYGIQTLRALLPIEPAAGETIALQELVVEDAPRFPYRGLHLDVARNFHPRRPSRSSWTWLLSTRSNRFHFHLTDDEGWRLPVAALPELTEVGSRRGHTDDESDRLLPSFGSGPDPDPATAHGSGAYSRDDFVAILRHAGDRHIQVIPEIDVPGHARAAIKAMAARHARLLATGREEEAAASLLTDPQDSSEYRSVQGWDDNVIDVCLPSTYRFLEVVFDEIIGLWAEAGAALEAIHVGGDEVPTGVWMGSPACDLLIRETPELNGTADLPAYFLGRVGDLLTARGLTTAGWEEIALTAAGDDEHAKRPSEEFVDRGFQPYVWNNVWGWGAEDVGYRLANAGYSLVLANATNLYFDLAYDKHPEEPGYAWAGFVDTRKAWEFVPLDLYRNARTDLMGKPLDPATAFAGRARLTDQGRQRIRGIQGQLWSENSKGPDVLEYQLFPKLLGLAERAWAAQPAWARVEETAERRRQEAIAWNEFANRLGRYELPRLDHLFGGVHYRLPPPGAVVRDGLLHANTAFPGLAIRYTTDGSEPVKSSTLYRGPVAVQGTVKLGTFDTRGRGSRIVAVTADD